PESLRPKLPFRTVWWLRVSSHDRTLQHEVCGVAQRRDAITRNYQHGSAFDGPLRDADGVAGDPGSAGLRSRASHTAVARMGPELPGTYLAKVESLRTRTRCMTARAAPAPPLWTRRRALSERTRPPLVRLLAG